MYSETFWVIVIVVRIICAVVAAIIANSKGRSVAGWFFGGLALEVLGVIIIACLSNKKEEENRFTKIEQDRRRLREQLRQEQIKNEAMRLHTAQRLDAHDHALNMDTRQTSGMLLTGQAEPPKALPDSPEAALMAMQQQGAPPATTIAPAGAVPPAPGEEQPVWFYEQAGRTCGPIKESQVLALIRQGSIQNHTLLWRQGFDDWSPAEKVAEFGWAVRA